MKKRFTDEQIISILREAETGAVSIKALCKKHNITEQTFFRWRNKFGDLDGQGTCDLGSGVALFKGSPFECSFTEFVGGNAGDVHTNKVTAKALDNEGDEATGDDSATVNINDVASTITLQKDAVPISVLETGDSDEKRSVAYTFTFSVDAGGVDKVTFNDLDDDVFGNLTSLCQVSKKNGVTLVPAVALSGFAARGSAAASLASRSLTSLCFQMTRSALEWRMPSIMEAWLSASEKMIRPGILAPSVPSAAQFET